MPRYFLHLHECGTVLEDDAGVVRGSVDDAVQAAIKSAREVMCAEVSEGRLCMACFIEIADETAPWWNG